MKNIISFAKLIITIIKSLRYRDTYLSLNNCDILLVCHDASRGEDFNGLPYSKFIDSFAELLIGKGATVKQFALPYSILLGKRAWGEPVSANRKLFIHDLGQAIRFVKPFGGRKYFSNSAETFYVNLLSKIKPISIVGIGLPRGLCSAARSLGISTFEVLHGYGYGTVPWGYLDDAISDLPNYIFSFDSVSTKIFSKLSPKGVHTIQIPNIWYRKFLDKAQSLQLPKEWSEEEIDWIPSGMKVVLVSLTSGYDGDNGGSSVYDGILRNGLFPEQLIDVITRTEEEVFWLFRLHPVQLRNASYSHHRELLRNMCKSHKNMEWVQSSRHTLPTLLMKADGHLSMISMTSYDAAFLGVPTMLLCPTLQLGGAHAHMFNDLFDAGYVQRGRFDVESIVVWSKEVHKRSLKFNPGYDIEIEEMLNLILRRAVHSKPKAIN